MNEQAVIGVCDDSKDAQQQVFDFVQSYTQQHAEAAALLTFLLPTTRARKAD